MLLRRLARPLLASSFVYDGVQAALHPAEHATAAREGSALVTERLGRPALSDAQVTLLVRAHGVATALAGLALALNKAPRTAALTLAALTAPLAAVNQPFTSKGEERSDKSAKFMRNLGSIGAALIAGADLEGRPGMSWRVQHARKSAARSTSKVAQKTAAKAGSAVHQATSVAQKAGRKVTATAHQAGSAAQMAGRKVTESAHQAQKARAGADR
jgi:uncharacterized membrane protein YphA (DoxX/SURF4 family)